MKNSCLFAALLAAAPLYAQLNVRSESPAVVAIKDAHIVTVSGSDVPKGTVVLRDGLIQAVGTNVDIPADAWVIDGAGLTVYPGFIDALSTWGIPAATPPAAGRAAGGQAKRRHKHLPRQSGARKTDQKPTRSSARRTW